MPPICRSCGAPLASDHALYCSRCGTPASRFSRVPSLSPAMRLLTYFLGAAMVVLALMLAVDATCAPLMSLPGMPGHKEIGSRIRVELILFLLAAGGLVVIGLVALFGRRE